MRHLLRFGLATVLAVSVAAPARAAVLNFENIVDGGSVVVTLAGITGTDILFDRLIATGTTADGTYLCASCKLNFTTGAFTGDSGYWHGGGSFVVTGTVHDGLTAGDPVIATGTLLSGSWAAYFPTFPIPTGGVNLSVDSGGFRISGGGTDDKHQDLLDHFGLENPFIYSNTDLTVTSGCDLGLLTSTGCAIREADLINTDEPLGVIPEPATLLLLGSGLLGLGHQARRRYRRPRRA